jgi:uncharacterized metal-binding protein
MDIPQDHKRGDMETIKPECAKCSFKSRICSSPQGEGPFFCPTLNRKATVGKTLVEYSKPEIGRFAHEASLQEAECYADRDKKPYVMHPVKPRVQETVEFAKRMGYKKLGLAFCSGLKKEALSLVRILEAQGFEVVSVICKAGCVPKETIGIRDEEKVRIGEYEAMCNPIMQAKILNEEKTDFNIMLGLCVGHDSLFLKYIEAFTTILVSKDRVLAHNPVGALYTSGSYYERLMKKR